MQHTALKCNAAYTTWQHIKNEIDVMFGISISSLCVLRCKFFHAHLQYYTQTHSFISPTQTQFYRNELYRVQTCFFSAMVVNKLTVIQRIVKRTNNNDERNSISTKIDLLHI